MALVDARHILDYYMDGYTAVPFCKVCSAEGLQPGYGPAPKTHTDPQIRRCPGRSH